MLAGSSSDIATALADARSQASAASDAATAAKNAGVAAAVVQAAAQASAFATTVAQVRKDSSCMSLVYTSLGCSTFELLASDPDGVMTGGKQQ